MQRIKFLFPFINLIFRSIDNLLNFAFVSFVDRLDTFSFLYYEKKRMQFFFYNYLGVQGVITYFYSSFKQISTFLDF